MPTPKGSNNLGSYDSFNERVLYDSISFLNHTFSKEQADMRVLNLYGKVDTKGNQILLPSRRFLEQEGMLVPVDNFGEKFMLSVFAEPFIKLRERFSHLFNRGFISEDSLFVGLEPERTLLFWEEEYENHLRQISESFYEYFNEHQDRDSVHGFLSFVEMFVKYATEACPYTVFTVKNYLISRFCDPLTTGMMIEVATGDASDDTSKYNNFISDPNYAKFVEEAAYYGFIVDKHVPWRLVVNPNSEYIKSSLSENGFPSLQKMFSEVYIDPTMVGFEMFLKMMERMYEMMLTKSPQYLVSDYSTGTASATVKFREKIKFKNPKKIMEKMGDELTLRVYAFLRTREANMNLSQSQFDSLAKKALDFKKQVDLKSAIVYIDDRTREGSSSDKKPSFRI